LAQMSGSSSCLGTCPEEWWLLLGLSYGCEYRYPSWESGVTFLIGDDDPTLKHCPS
jgi:hypothetical protein